MDRGRAAPHAPGMVLGEPLSRSRRNPGDQLMRRVVPALALVLLAASARADDRTGSLLVFPGSLSASVGTIGPAEAGNVVTVVRTEQSVALWRIGAALIGGTVVAGASTDLDGYAWNRTQPYTVGAKVM